MVSVLHFNADKEFYEFLVNALSIVYWINYMSLGDISFISMWYEQSLLN